MTAFLRDGNYPPNFDITNKRHFRLQSIPYVLVNGILFKKDFNGVLLRYIKEDQVSKVLEEFHDGPSSGHFSARTTVMKIIRAGYYWSSLFKVSHKWVRRCKECAFFLSKQRLVSLPLHPIQIDKPFTQWGLDFIGPIYPLSSIGHKWILATIDYFRRWTEVATLKDATKHLVVYFLEGILTRYGAPSTIISENTNAFYQSSNQFMGSQA
ncbi:hypothetical protein SUGI_0829410 [Cryptomeria japonica]|nr:hypothetical protein SUGI_0829410 [Cryptomeria japonica]